MDAIRKAQQVYNAHCATAGCVDLAQAQAAGMIPLDDLEPYVWYFGYCRNATLACWDGKQFFYVRHKFGGRDLENIPHPQDDAGLDVFVPVCKVEAPEA